MNVSKTMHFSFDFLQTFSPRCNVHSFTNAFFLCTNFQLVDQRTPLKKTARQKQKRYFFDLSLTVESKQNRASELNLVFLQDVYGHPCITAYSHNSYPLLTTVDFYSTTY